MGNIFSFSASITTGEALPGCNGFAASSESTPFPSFKGSTIDIHQPHTRKWPDRFPHRIPPLTKVNPSQRLSDAHIVPSRRCSRVRLAHHTTMRCASVRQKCQWEVPCPRLAGVPHSQRRLDASGHSIIPIFLVFHHKRRKSSLKDIRIKPMVVSPPIRVRVYEYGAMNLRKRGVCECVVN